MGLRDLGPAGSRSISMALFTGRSSLLEVQNRALIKTAKERAARIEKLEAELQSLRQRDDDNRGLLSLGDIEKLQRDLQASQALAQHQGKEIERLTLERDFYSKRASALAEENRELTASAIKYSEQVQKLERELRDVGTTYSLRAQKRERELTEAATKYSLWGQKLERELARIDPDGAPARRFNAQQES
jgi:hypothetical protein